MIVFTHIDPDYFRNMMGSYQLADVKTMNIYNLSSLDTRYPLLSALLPDVDFISREALINRDDDIFEQEYFRFLDSEVAFPYLMMLMCNEFLQGATHLTLIEIARSPQRDSVVFSLQKYLFMRYGIKAVFFADLEDWNDISPANSVFSPDGLMLMDRNMLFIDQSCIQNQKG